MTTERHQADELARLRAELLDSIPSLILEALHDIPLPGGRVGVPRARVRMTEGPRVLVLLGDEAGPLGEADVRMVRQLLDAYVRPIGIALDVRADDELLGLPRVALAARAVGRLLGSVLGDERTDRLRFHLAALRARWLS
jgi:hypothetical protein